MTIINTLCVYTIRIVNQHKTMSNYRVATKHKITSFQACALVYSIEMIFEFSPQLSVVRISNTTRKGENSKRENYFINERKYIRNYFINSV